MKDDLKGVDRHQLQCVRFNMGLIIWDDGQLVRVFIIFSTMKIGFFSVALPGGWGMPPGRHGIFLTADPAGDVLQSQCGRRQLSFHNGNGIERLEHSKDGVEIGKRKREPQMDRLACRKGDPSGFDGMNSKSHIGKRE